MTHKWKIGDWASGGTIQKRWLVVYVDDYVVRGVSLGGDGFVTDLNRNQITHLPDCTGWTWQPPKPVEPPKGYRLLVQSEVIDENDIAHNIDWMPVWNQHVGRTFDPVLLVPMARKIEPKVRPMTRAEFLAAWKQRGFCPLIDTEQDVDTVAYVTVETEFDRDCVSMFNAGWCSMDELADYKFASDETYLTVEE